MNVALRGAGISIEESLPHWVRVLPPAWAWGVLSGLLLLAALAYESRTSALQSYLLPRYAAKLTYEIEAGPSPRIEFPRSSPYGQRLGYSLLPDFQQRLDSQGFRIVEQARMAEPMAQLVRIGITPPYDEPAAAGLVVHAAHDESRGESMFDARHPQLFFVRFEDIPPLVVESLLFIENRELLAEASLSESEAVQRLLGDRVSPRRLAMVFYAWHAGADQAALARWFAERVHPISMAEASRLARACKAYADA